MKPILEYQDIENVTQCVVTSRIVRIQKVWIEDNDPEIPVDGQVAIFLDDGSHVWSRDSYRTLSARLESALGDD